MAPDALIFERLLTAVATTGFTSDWVEQGRSRVQEGFSICRSARTLEIYEQPVLRHTISTERSGRAHTSSVPSDWSINDFLTFARNLLPSEVDRLPNPDTNLPCVRAFRELVANGGGMLTGDHLHAHIVDDKTQITCATKNQWGAEALILVGDAT